MSKIRFIIYDATQVDENIPYIFLDDHFVEISRRYYVVKDENGCNRAIPVKIKGGVIGRRFCSDLHCLSFP